MTVLEKVFEVILCFLELFLHTYLATITVYQYHGLYFIVLEYTVNLFHSCFLRGVVKGYRAESTAACILWSLLR